MGRKRGASNKTSRQKILNAFDTAVDDKYYIKGLRQQQDIDLDQVADERIRDLLSNTVNPEDDEDIDSDEAMGSASEISLGEPDSGNESEWGDSFDESELMTLSEIWDLDDKEKLEEARAADPNAKDSSEPRTGSGQGRPKPNNVKDKLRPNHELESESVSGSGSESESESGSDSADSGSGSEADSESADELDLDGMSDASSSDDEDNEALLKAIKSVSGVDDMSSASHRLVDAGEENPFSLPSASGSLASEQDFIPGTKQGKTLSVPAPQRVQERAERAVALDLANKELGKWADTVAANRQAESLQFPINAPPELQAASPFVATVATEQNSLEQKISGILQTSALADENAVSTFEELAPSHLSIEEVRKRRDQLRYMRELAYREEQRAKRIKKIKSKSFRKIHKREKERMHQLEHGEEDDEEDLEKAERQRALERATLRHRANSKWAKRMSDQGLTRDAGTRSEIEEMLRQGEALKEKIRGGFDSESEDSGDSESERLRLETESKEEAPKKGVLAMKFMQEAEDRERKANERRLRDDFSDADSEEENIGRKSFNPAGQQLKRDLAAMQEEEESEGSDDLANHDARQATQAAHKRQNKKEKREIGAEVVELRNVESMETEEGGRPSRALTGNRQPQKPKRNDSSSEPGVTAQVTDVESNPWLLAAAQSSTPGEMALSVGKNVKPEVRVKGQRPSKYNNISVENTLGESMVREKDLSLKQQDLVREAFASDDVVASFEAEKQSDQDADGDQEIDETLPGWGSWSNDKPRVQKVRKIIGIKRNERQDFKKGNVIINEKVNKKAAKYNASAVPFPFENRQQYERSLRMPIGQEWVTKDTFQRQTKPRVVVKRGTVIDPIRKPPTN